MIVVIAPQSFKGTLSGVAAADAMHNGVRRVLPHATTRLVPMADGGHGTLDALLGAANGTRHTLSVTGPTGEQVVAGWGTIESNEVGTGIVEMAQASGLTLVPEHRRDPMATTTYGTGEVLAAALEAGHRRIIVGVGGSATNDGGAGAAQALGVRLTDAHGDDIAFGAAGLAQLAHASIAARHPGIGAAEIIVASDVSNPLTGPDGAAFTYGPQKGAPPEILPLLDAALKQMAEVVERDLGVNLRDVEGMGAAGGLAAGLVAFLGARLVWGAEVIADAVGLDGRLEGADLVITGEGRIDWQTVFHKAPIEVAKRAARRGIAVLGVGGSLGPGATDVLAHGMVLIEGASAPDAPVPQDEAGARAALADATERAIRRWLGS
jgi:glycerate kinase